MKRLQTIVLSVWAFLVLLFAVFNWDLLWREEPIMMLFMEFHFPWVFWFALIALALPLLFYWVGSVEKGRTAKRGERELAALKSRAFDDRNDDLEGLVERILSGVESRVRDLLADREGSAAPGEGDPAKSAQEKDG